MAVVTPDLPELFEEAYERAGLEMRSGYDLKTARRSLNILTVSRPTPSKPTKTRKAGQPKSTSKGSPRKSK